MRSVTWNRFPIKNLWLTLCFFHLWSEVTWIQICASWNGRKKMKAEPSRMIPLKSVENVEAFIAMNVSSRVHFLILKLPKSKWKFNILNILMQSRTSLCSYWSRPVAFSKHPLYIIDIASYCFSLLYFWVCYSDRCSMLWNINYNF